MKSEQNVLKFPAEILEINSWDIVWIPEKESLKLPSRGMNMVEGKINNISFKAVLEPDGKGSHWLNIDSNLLKKIKVKPGDRVSLEIWPTKEWIEPVIPDDLNKALKSNPQVLKLWHDITPMARWDWIRWVRSTKQEETRKRRIDVAISKLKKGTRRPCCFNRNLCTEPQVSNNWILIEK